MATCNVILQSGFLSAYSEFVCTHDELHQHCETKVQGRVIPAQGAS